MVQVRCPQCGSLVEGIEGQEAVCGSCGFRALLPVQPAPGPTGGASVPLATPAVPPATASARPSTPKNESLTGGGILAVWGYILGLAAVATFFLASYGLPFAFGGAAIVLGLMARQRDPKDRRAFIGLVFGVAAVLAAILWILA